MLERKAIAREAEPVRIDAARADALRGEIARYEALAQEFPAPGKAPVGDLDELLRRWIGKQQVA